MKKLSALSIALCFLFTFSQCKKEDDDNNNNNNNTATCSSIADDVILMDGKEFTLATSQPVACASTPINGATWYTHIRSAANGTGSSLNQPDINITLSSVPATGVTTTYTVDEGMWQTASTAAPAGKATFRMNNYQDQYGYTEYWFGDSQSGTIEVTDDGAGNVKFNFTEVKLVKSGGTLTDRKSVCGKNLICH